MGRKASKSHGHHWRPKQRPRWPNAEREATLTIARHDVGADRAKEILVVVRHAFGLHSDQAFKICHLDCQATDTSSRCECRRWGAVYARRCFVLWHHLDRDLFPRTQTYFE